MFCSFFSSSTGLMSMKQSLSLKNVFIYFLIIFFLTTRSETPFWSLSAFSRQCLGDIGLPCQSSRRSAKSLTSQRRVGKHQMMSCMCCCVPFCRSLLRLMMRLRLCTAFSSMLPTELQMKQEDRSRAIRKILVSACSPSSKEPSPSVSMTMYCSVGSCGQGSSSGHTHSPFVHAFIVGPTSNPWFWFSSTLFIMQLFPVRYLPTTVTTPTCLSWFARCSHATASGFTLNSIYTFSYSCFRRRISVAAVVFHCSYRYYSSTYQQFIYSYHLIIIHLQLLLIYSYLFINNSSILIIQQQFIYNYHSSILIFLLIIHLFLSFNNNSSIIITHLFLSFYQQFIYPYYLLIIHLLFTFSLSSYQQFIYNLLSSCTHLYFYCLFLLAAFQNTQLRRERRGEGVLPDDQIIIQYEFQAAVMNEGQRQREGKAHRVDKYVFHEDDLLAKGKFSRVFLGKHQQTRHPVAIKQIRNAQITTKIARRLLQCEQTSLCLLHHPNVIRCLSLHASENYSYIITDFCEGGDLAGVLQRHGALSEVACRPLLLDILLGLEYLSSLAIIHRDLKLQNIFLRKGRAVIGDFGFSIRRDRAFKDTLLGSPISMSPQAVFNCFYGAKTDVWSFGILIYQLLNGTAPLSNCTSQEEVKDKILQPLSFSFPVSSQLVQIIKMCTIFDQNHRATIQDIGNTNYFRNLKSQRQRNQMGYFVIEQPKREESAEGSDGWKNVSKLGDASTEVSKSDDVSTMNSVRELPVKTVCLVFGEISSKLAQSLVHYCRLVHKICKECKSGVLAKWLKMVSLALVGAKVVCYEPDNIQSIIHEYHLKYMTLYHEFALGPVLFHQVLAECSKGDKNVKFKLACLAAETKLLKKLYERAQIEKYTAKSKCLNALAHFYPKVS